MTLWIKSPLAIITPGAENGLVIENDKIIELVPAGSGPANFVDKIFDASSHVILPD